MTRLCRRVAEYLFAFLLRCYPAAFQSEFRAEMEAAFAQRLRQAVERGGPLALLRRSVVDLSAAVVGVVAERLSTNTPHPTLTHSPPRGDPVVMTLLLDLRQALRSLRLAPGFTVAAVLTLGLGIGLNTAIFSVIQAVLLRPLPYEAPDRLVAVNVTFQSQRWWSAALADVLEWRELSGTLESVAFGITSSLAVQSEALPEQVPGVRVSANWFDTLGVAPSRGRAFLPGEDSPAADRVAVLSHGYWANRLGADPGAVGSTFRVDGNETTIVGVLPASYRADFWGNPQIYVTRRFTVDDAAERVRIYLAVARLGDGVSLAAAQADSDRISTIMADRFPDAMQGWGVQLRPLHEAVTGGQRDLLVMLLGAVGLVLLVACANVSNLILARATRQRHDLAVRTALGASRGRLVRQLLAETGLLALCGGVLGLVLASWGTDILLAQAPQRIPRIDQAGVDPVVLLFTVGVCLLTGMLFGLLPAIRGSRTDASAVLRADDSRTGTPARTFGARGLLVTAELALVVTLLVGAGVALRSFQALQKVDLGFEPADKLVVPVTLPTSFEYDEIDGIARFFQELREQVAASPAVAAVADVSIPPLFGGSGMTAYHIIEGRDYEPGAEPTGGIEIVSPGYFELMGMEILEGRTLSDLDTGDSALVVVVNDAMARLYWDDASPLGARLRVGPDDGGPLVSRWLEVVGVVRGVRYGPEQEVRPRLYIPDPQMPAPMNFRAVIVVPRGGDAFELVPIVREAVAAIQSTQPIGTPRDFDSLAEGSLSTRRLQSLLLGLFGLVALTLGAVGVYGVVAYTVSQRTREMGIRMALGAEQWDVLGLVLRGAMAPVGLGVIIGLGASLGLSGLMASLLPGVHGPDPAVLLLVPSLLAAIALLASWVPARRATRVDPVSSLRAK